MKHHFPLALVLLLLGACAPLRRAAAPLRADSSVVELPLAGPVAGDSAEISGMAWWRDELILLPQYPDRFRRPGDDGAIFLLARAEVESAVDAALRGAPVPLAPRRVAVSFSRPEARVRGYEGLEAIVVEGDRAWLTIEATHDSVTVAYLARATLQRDPDRLRVDSVRPIPIRPAPRDRGEAVRRRNFGEEALLLADSALISFHEINGRAFGEPTARAFGTDLRLRGLIPLLPLEYRVTDATAPDPHGRFWVLNFFWPGERLLGSTADPLAACAGHAVDPEQRVPVERLVELQLTNRGLGFSGRPPRYLAPPRDPARAPRDNAYNWEAVARLGERGLLVATDKFPRTVLAFVPMATGSAPRAVCW